jgi:opacity protein-like surface antigen
MKKLTLVAIVAMLSSSAMATPTPPTPITNVVSTMNGQIDVGTAVYAAPNQAQTQTSTGSLSGFTTVSPGAIINNVAQTPVITSSITGTASSVTSGTGFTLPSFNVANNPAVSAISQGTISTSVTNFSIPVTSITPVTPHNHDD